MWPWHPACVRVCWGAHVVHSPRPEEVGKVLHDRQGHAFLLQRKLPLVGGMEGKPEGMLNVGQQVQAEETRGGEEKHKSKER